MCSSLSSALRRRALGHCRTALGTVMPRSTRRKPTACGDRASPHLEWVHFARVIFVILKWVRLPQSDVRVRALVVV